jgi:spermidine synthase
MAATAMAPTTASPALAGIGASAESPPGLGRLAWLVVLVTGFIAIAYEIVWFRVIEVLVKASPYAFSTVLAVYLCGIALGSFAMQRALARTRPADERSLFFLLQFLTGCYVGLSFIGYYFLTLYTPLRALTRASFWQADHPTFELPDFRHPSLVFSSVDIVAWPLLFVFVPTLLIGASFPLISSLALSKADEEGRTVGEVYFFNTLGNVLGGLVTGFLLLPVLGTERTLLLLIAANLLMGPFVATAGGRRLAMAPRAAAVFGLLGLVALTFPGPGRLYAAMHFPAGEHDRVFQAEGIEGVVYTYQDPGRIGNFINGQVHGGRPNLGFYAQAIEALSCAKRARNILVIGFGTGSFVEAAEWAPGVQRITLVELNGTLIRNTRQVSEIRNILSDPRLDIVIDDGRRYLLTSDERFDLVMMDPLRTTTAYSNNLFSRQFSELVGRHLTPEGVFLIWMDETEVVPRTVRAAFPYIRCYGGSEAGFCIASASPLRPDEAVRNRLLVDFGPVERGRILGATREYLGDSTYVDTIPRDLPINEDRRPVCEYYLRRKVRRRRLPSGPLRGPSAHEVSR